MSFWGNVGRVGLGVATGGLSEAAKYGYDQTYGKDNAAQHAAANYAENASTAYGKNMRDYYGQQGKQALSYFSGGQPSDASRGGYDYNAAWGLPAAQQPLSPDQALINMQNNRPGQQQTYFDYMKGQAGGLTNQEQLYNERKGGYDPAQAYQDQQATAQINQQLAARGMANSTPGVRQLTDYQANAGAQRSKALADLAGGADSSRNALSTTYGGAASGASKEQSDYFGGLMKSSQDLAQAKADTFGHYSDQGSSAYSDAQKMAMDAHLQGMGIDAATRKQMIGDVTGALVGGTKLAMSGGAA